MHELPYEPPREGAGDSRRLARWLAAWIMAAFGLMGVGYSLSFGDALTWDREMMLVEFASGGYLLGHAISGLSFPLAAAALGVWLVTGRVVVWLLASAPIAVGAGGLFINVRLMAEYGAQLSTPTWPWLPVNAAYFVLGLLFLTRTFRRAVNAPRTARG